MLTCKFGTGLVLAGALVFVSAGDVLAQQNTEQGAQRGWINLPTSKQLMAPAPGDPRRVNSLPTALAVSPDGSWVVSLNTGYGTVESGYKQSLTVLNVATGDVKDFPEARTLVESRQALFEGLAFSADGTKVYASMGSTNDAEGEDGGDTGDGIVVYGFADGVLKAEGFLKLPLVRLAAGRHSTLLSRDDRDKFGISYPAGIAVASGARQKLVVAENLSDSVALIDATTGAVEHVFDLAAGTSVPTTYPLDVVVTKDGRRAFVSLWNASEVVELDLVRKTVARRVTLLKPGSSVDPGTHPCALLLDEREGLLYVALSNRDAVAAVEIGKSAVPPLVVRGYFDTRLPGQSYFGAEPDALAMNADGSRLYAANMGSDAVAVIDAHKLRGMAQAKGMVEPIGFVPTELMPTALAFHAGKLFVATGKGKGTGPNAPPQPITDSIRDKPRMRRKFTYSPTLLYGSLAVTTETSVEAGLKESTEVVLESNRMKAAEEKIAFAGGVNPIKHVIYIIKENRTYDQVFGDLAKDAKPVGNGDPKLTMYGQSVTPNQHRLALQFGVLDNFFDSGEVSGQGHVWSNAAIGTDYLEKTWPENYSNTQRTYDYEGMVADGYPLLQHIPDVNEPASGYIWTNLVAHGKSIYHFGEYVSSTFCGTKKDRNVDPDPKLGAKSDHMAVCADAAILPGGQMPAEWGGEKNQWPWAIPRLAKNVPTKPELVGHSSAFYPDFNLRVPDQVRVGIFLRQFDQWKRDRAAGHDTMPVYIQLRLPNDHTGGTTVGGPTPKASVADNDLAIGRAVEAVSHSDYWDDTAFFILEDDAQNGADHVDAHRSLAIVVSKYAPHPKAGEAAVIDSRFYSTVSVLRTIETLLGVPPMNNNDAFSSMISTLFTGPGDQEPYTADTSNRENGLIYMANAKATPGAAASAKMDFTHADRADSGKLNLILWRDAMGDAPPPAMLLEKHAKKKDGDD
jgi:DNA-binding beta-propeller fold protein YncE